MIIYNTLTTRYTFMFFCLFVCLIYITLPALYTYHPSSAERQEIRGLNLPGPPWAISTACCGRDLYLYLLHSVLVICT